MVPEYPRNDLDEILMANSLHYVRGKAGIMKGLQTCFKAERRFLIVEYENRWPSPWVPYPVNVQQLAGLANKLGYRMDKFADLPSRYCGTLYSALLSIL